MLAGRKTTASLSMFVSSQRVRTSLLQFDKMFRDRHLLLTAEPSLPTRELRMDVKYPGAWRDNLSGAAQLAATPPATRSLSSL